MPPYSTTDSVACFTWSSEFVRANRASRFARSWGTAELKFRMASSAFPCRRLISAWTVLSGSNSALVVSIFVCGSDNHGAKVSNQSHHSVGTLRFPRM